MEVFDNINKIVRDDLSIELKKGSRISIAAACFSIYAYRELKSQLDKNSVVRNFRTTAVDGKSYDTKHYRS